MVKNLVVIALCSVGLLPLKAQDKDYAIKNGVGVNLFWGVPSNHYRFSDPYSLQRGNLLGVQFNSRTYFVKQSKWGCGLLINWAELNIGLVSGYPNNAKKRTIELSAFGVGPYVTYKVAPNKAFDTYYNLRPTFMMWEPYQSEFQKSQFAASFVHALGFSYRYKAMCIGVELGIDKWGNERSKYAVEYSQSTRLLLGFKF